jgi:hypothetical protein
LTFAGPSVPFLDNILCYKGNFVLLDERPEYVCINGNAEYAVWGVDENRREEWENGSGAERTVSGSNANSLLRYGILILSISSTSWS